MKRAYIFLATCCLLASGLAKPVTPLLDYQDSYGQYSFGYSGPNSARSEYRTMDGVTHGSYSYIDDSGVIQVAHYIADDMGFRITATNLPQAPVSMYVKQTAIATRNTHEEATKMKLEDEKTVQTEIGKNNVFLKHLVDVSTAFQQEMSETEIGKNNVFLKHLVDVSNAFQQEMPKEEKETSRNVNIKSINSENKEVENKMSKEDSAKNVVENVKKRQTQKDDIVIPSTSEIKVAKETEESNAATQLPTIPESEIYQFSFR